MAAPTSNVSLIALIAGLIAACVAVAGSYFGYLVVVVTITAVGITDGAFAVWLAYAVLAGVAAFGTGRWWAQIVSNSTSKDAQADAPDWFVWTARFGYVWWPLFAVAVVACLVLPAGLWLIGKLPSFIGAWAVAALPSPFIFVPGAYMGVTTGISLGSRLALRLSPRDDLSA